MEVAKECIPLAPIHNPANITGIEAFKKALPDIPITFITNVPPYLLYTASLNH